MIQVPANGDYLTIQILKEAFQDLLQKKAAPGIVPKMFEAVRKGFIKHEQKIKDQIKIVLKK